MAEGFQAVIGITRRRNKTLDKVWFFAYRLDSMPRQKRSGILALYLPPKFLENVFVPSAYYFLHVYLSLLSFRVIGEEKAFQALNTHRRVIAALWHQRILPSLGYVKRFRGFNPCIMISQSQDGDLISPIAERLGLRPIRGSSSKGGREALVTIVRILRASRAAVHIVDGPLGPKGVVKAGLIQMAQVTGAVIMPVYVSANRAWLMKSWDRFLVPKPFSSVTIRWGDPFFVPRKLDTESFEALRKEIEGRMAEGYARQDLACGWKEPL